MKEEKGKTRMHLEGEFLDHLLAGDISPEEAAAFREHFNRVGHCQLCKRILDSDVGRSEEFGVALGRVLSPEP